MEHLQSEEPFSSDPYFSPSCFEAHVGLFRLLMNGIFAAFGTKFIFELVTHVRTHNFTVYLQFKRHISMWDTLYMCYA